MDQVFNDVINAPYFSVIEETAEYIVVDKPAHLLTHPSKPGQPYTLWDGLRDLLVYDLACGAQLSIINRLDRETSGIILVAKTLDVARDLHRVMEMREAAKEYLAICLGWPAEEDFVVEVPLRKRCEVEMSRVNLQQMVHPEGAPSKTTFSVERRFRKLGVLGADGQGQKFSLVRARPHTGRMHQIRVHLAHLGHPVVGDKLYMQPDGALYLEHIETGWTPALEERLLLSRQALHSCRLDVPWTDTESGRKSWEAPLAEDLRAFIASAV